MAKRSKFLELTIILSALLLLVSNGFAQERRAKLRISNAGFTITALPLLAAKDWGLFTANGLDMEVILMQSSLGAGGPDSRRHRLSSRRRPRFRQCHHDWFCDPRHLVFLRPNFVLAHGQAAV